MSGIVEAENVTKRYGEVLGLNGFTAQFGPGITALIGPNGAGKSTLFRLLTGQLRSNSGRLTVLDRDPWVHRSESSAVGYCPEHPAVYGWMTPTDFVTYLLRLDGFPRAAAASRAAEAIATVGLAEAAHRRLRGFSKGMRQRVEVAQALAHDPSLLLLDEPLNGLDPVGRVALLELFERLARSGHHLIVSSHVLYEVERLTEEIVMISNGRVLAFGNVHRIRDALDAHPHSILLRTKVPRLLAERLAGWPHVTSLEIGEPDRLTVRTRAPDTFYRDLPALVLDGSIDVTEMSSPDDNLEAVFRFLTE
ncbi:MAG TPA: ABC transporter ATP-binding protein [Thermoplasmata archaeon]|nr:ABC transporter ATP-binding protein [Thermoplasmata archaeon]